MFDLISAHYDEFDRLVPDEDSQCPLYKGFPVSCDTDSSSCIYYFDTKNICDRLFVRCRQSLDIDA